MDHANSGGTGNGATGARPVVTRVKLVLDFDPMTFDLHIGGEIGNYDMARAVLAQADRWFETQQRQAAALDLRNKIAQAAVDEQIARNLRAGR